MRAMTGRSKYNDDMKPAMTRRNAIRKAASYTALAASASLVSKMAGAENTLASQLKGNIHHSVCRWCYHDVSLDDLCDGAKQMGLRAIDLLDPVDFLTVKKHGLICSMVSFPTVDGLGGIPKAWNRLEHHDKLV
jgi:hydroxypyruvate isomerase